MSGAKKSLRIPSSPKADFLYSTFDHLASDTQRSRSNSEASSGRKVIAKPKNITTDRSSLRRHTTEKTEILDKLSSRPAGRPPIWETRIAELDEDSPPKFTTEKCTISFSPRSLRKTEWSERIFFRRRSETVRRNLVILNSAGVIGAGPPMCPEKLLRSQLTQGLGLIRQHYQLAVFLTPQEDASEAQRFFGDFVDALYISRNTENIGSGKKVWMQNYAQVITDFESSLSKTIVVCALYLAPDEYEGKTLPAMVVEAFNGGWQFHVNGVPIGDLHSTVVCVPFLSAHPQRDPSMVEVAHFVVKTLAAGAPAAELTCETSLYAYELQWTRKHPCASLVSAHRGSLVPVVQVLRPPPVDDFKQVHHAGAVMTFRTLNPKVVSEAEKQAEQQLLASCKCPQELKSRCYITRWKHCSTERHFCQFRVLDEPLPRTWGQCRFVVML